MLKKKKAQGLTMNTIILIIIGLIVLILVIFLLTGKLSGFGSSARQSNTCEFYCNSIGADRQVIDTVQICENVFSKSVVVRNVEEVPEDRICCCVWDN